MKKLFKRMTATAIATLVAMSMAVTANAATTSHRWSALGRNIVGAPTSVTSQPDVFTIYHGKAGATATMEDVDNSIPGSPSKTYIYCNTYNMKTVEFTNYEEGEKPVKPDVGNPIVDIPVEYRVSASTSTIGNTVITTGLLEKAKA